MRCARQHATAHQLTGLLSVQVSLRERSTTVATLRVRPASHVPPARCPRPAATSVARKLERECVLPAAERATPTSQPVVHYCTEHDGDVSERPPKRVCAVIDEFIHASKLGDELNEDSDACKEELQQFLSENDDLLAPPAPISAEAAE